MTSAAQRPHLLGETRDDFRAFTFANTVRLWGTQNPKFFEGTTVAKAAAEELARAR